MKLCRMYLRWDRSYIKEEIRFVRIVWKRPLLYRVICVFEKLVTNLRFPINYVVLCLIAASVMSHPDILLRLFFAIGVVSSINMLYYLHTERSWDFIYGVFYAYFAFLCLFWIFPTAAFTLRSRSWMTR
jgi:hyaluronan synthase